MRDCDPITRLTDARFDGPQALYTEAVRLLSERPALPDDMAGLAARLRDGEACGDAVCKSMDARSGCICAEAADAIEALAAKREAAVVAALEAAADEALMCTSPQWAAELCAKIIRAMITDDARAALDRIKADAKAEGMRDGLREALLIANSQEVRCAEWVAVSSDNPVASEQCAQIASDILAKIKEVRK